MFSDTLIYAGVMSSQAELLGNYDVKFVSMKEVHNFLEYFVENV